MDVSKHGHYTHSFLGIGSSHFHNPAKRVGRSTQRFMTDTPPHYSNASDRKVDTSNIIIPSRPALAATTERKQHIFSRRWLTTAILMLLACLLNSYLDPFQYYQRRSMFVYHTTKARDEACAMTLSMTRFCPPPGAGYVSRFMTAYAYYRHCMAGIWSRNVVKMEYNRKCSKHAWDQAGFIEATHLLIISLYFWTLFNLAVSFYRRCRTSSFFEASLALSRRS